MAVIYEEKPGDLDIIVGANNVLSKILTFSSKSGVTLTPFVLSGYTFESYIFLNNTETITINIVVTDIDLAVGKIKMYCDALSTLTRGDDTYRWLLRWTDTNSIKRVVLQGKFKIV
jgi:hypothetical protein